MADRMKMYEKVEALLETSKADPHFDDYYHFVLNRIMQRFKKYPESDDCDIDIYVNQEGKIIVVPIVDNVRYKDLVISKETVNKLQREEDVDSYFKKFSKKTMSRDGRKGDRNHISIVLLGVMGTLWVGVGERRKKFSPLTTRTIRTCCLQSFPKASEARIVIRDFPGIGKRYRSKGSCCSSGSW
ncbi:MAG: hypothetical protein LBH16_03965 [Treponema sp.]|jgi:hypothetical protein|nr:hypothetical protein [Treponema sp.]